MKCPNCGSDMWFNPPQNKKNPKSPDYKCKNKECIDPKTGYVTAIWLAKPKNPVSIPNNTLKAPVISDKGAKMPIVKEVLNASDIALSLVRSKALAGGYKENITEAIYDDYILYKNRVEEIDKPVLEIKVEEESFDEQF